MNSISLLNDPLGKWNFKRFTKDPDVFAGVAVSLDNLCSTRNALVADDTIDVGDVGMHVNPDMHTVNSYATCVGGLYIYDNKKLSISVLYMAPTSSTPFYVDVKIHAREGVSVIDSSFRIKSPDINYVVDLIKTYK